MLECNLCGDLTADHTLFWKLNPETGHEVEFGFCPNCVNWVENQPLWRRA